MAKTSTDHLRVPPQNIEAEMSVLGSLMLDKDAIIQVADIVRIGDFYKDDHNRIYEAILKLYEDNEPIDVLSLANRLEETSLLEKVGGSSYL
ncbi:MAG: replicative DNA helicase, partial [Candidatus Moranbacteria bacterium]|nr:replicative DNA helicase [Candidatus Moranbacteria bacterium]